MAGPTPPPQADTTPQAPEVGPSKRERIFGAIGGVLAAGGRQKYEDTPLGKALADYHKKRQDAAGMYWQTATQYYAQSVSAYDEQGNPMTEEKRQEYRNKADAAYAEYAKIAGFSKEAKAAIAQSKQKLDQGLSAVQQHITQKTGAGPAPSATGAGGVAEGAGGGGGGMTPPPSPATPAAAPAATPPPAPKPALSRSDIMAPPDAAHGKALGEEKDLLALQHKYKMEEEQAKGRHMQAKNVEMPDGTVLTAGFDPNTNKFYDQDNNELVGAKMVTASALTPKKMLYLEKDAQGKPTIPRIGIEKGDKFYDMAGNELPPDTTPLMRGLIGTISTSKDQFGNVTVTVRNPLLGTEPEAPGAPAAAPAPKTSAPPKHAAPSAPAAPGGGRGATPSQTPPKAPAAAAGGGSAAAAPSGGTVSSGEGGAQAPPQIVSAVSKFAPQIHSAAERQIYGKYGLDDTGHIPAAAGDNPQVRELANQLLDGVDIKDLRPAKGAPPAEALARRYGWSRGKFTPKEMVMLRESETFLEKAMNDPSLSALDEGFWKRMKTGQSSLNPEHEGLLRQGLTLLSSQHLSEKEATLVEMNNQLVGTISGMAQLVRSGRATEATIDRLKAELPNLFTTKSSAHAKQRIQRLLSEIDVAMERGYFDRPPGGAEDAKPGSMTPPPKPAGKAASTSKAAPPSAAPKPKYAVSPGKPTLESTDGGKTWHHLPSVQ